MNYIAVKRIFFLLILFSLSASVSLAQRSSGRPDRALFGKTLKTRQAKVRESRSVVKAKKKQESNEKKLQKEYRLYVKESRKRALKIQTPEVRERMIQDRKNSDQKARIKKKKRTENFRKAGLKF